MRRVEALEEAAPPTQAHARRTVCCDLSLPSSPTGALRHAGRLAELYAEGRRPVAIARAMATELGVSFDAHRMALIRTVEMYG
jgi:hypothetical protein